MLHNEEYGTSAKDWHSITANIHVWLTHNFDRLTEHVTAHCGLKTYRRNQRWLNVDLPPYVVDVFLVLIGPFQGDTDKPIIFVVVTSIEIPCWCVWHCVLGISFPGWVRHNHIHVISFEVWQGIALPPSDSVRLVCIFIIHICMYVYIIIINVAWTSLYHITICGSGLFVFGVHLLRVIFIDEITNNQSTCAMSMIYCFCIYSAPLGVSFLIFQCK